MGVKMGVKPHFLPFFLAIKKAYKPLLHKDLQTFCVMAEKERFELSRRFKPAYTLSRGASSAS